MRRPRAAVLAPEEAASAIYVDYETNMDRPPTLVGWMVGDVFCQAIVEPAFGTVAGRRGVQRVTVRDHAEFVERLVARAERQKRVIVSWSTHDRKIMIEAVPRLRERIVALHRNAITTARRWSRRVRGKRVPRPDRLPKYLELVGYRVPAHHGPGRVGAYLRALRQQLAAGRSWATLTPAARRRWRDVVGHNRHDVLGMRQVVLTAARGLSAHT